MFDAALLRQVDEKLRGMLDGDAVRPNLPDSVAAWRHDTPHGECLSLLSSLLRFSEQCTTHPAAFGYCWNQAMRVVAGLTAEGRSLVGTNVLDVGAGVENPVGVSLILAMLGAERAMSVDRLALFDVSAVAEATLRFVTHLAGLFPALAWRLPGLVRPEILAKGRFFEAFTSPWFSHQTCDVTQARATYLFDVVHSNGLVQMLMDPEPVVASMSRLTAVGGCHVHLVDFTDPDFYTAPDPSAPDARFRFLFAEAPPPGCKVNRLRLSQVAALFARHGLVLERSLQTWRQPMPAEVRTRLAQPFRDMADEDLETVAATLLFRKVEAPVCAASAAPAVAQPDGRTAAQAAAERERRRVLGEVLDASWWVRLGAVLGQCGPMRRSLADPNSSTADLENHVRDSRWMRWGVPLGVHGKRVRAIYTDGLRHGTDLTDAQKGAIRKALAETIFAERDPAWFDSPAGRDDMANHVAHRYAEGCNFYVPWVEKVMPLAGQTVVEIGCGTGASTAAFARRAGHVYGYDLDGPSVEAARRRVAAQGLGNVTLATTAAEEIVEGLSRRHAGDVDVVLLSAVLEHCTVQERLAYIAASWRALRPGGLLVVTETPNRLYFYDYHSSHLPFFHCLPEDLALLYAARSPREDFRSAVGAKGTDEEKRMRLARFGRGMSYHEFELAIGGDVRPLVAADGWDTALLRLRPLEPCEDSLRRTVAHYGYAVHPGFLRRDIDVVLRKPREA